MLTRTRTVAKLTAVVLLALVLQSSVLDALRIRHVHPDLLLLVSVLAGLAGGPEKGVLVGFGAGLLSDLVLTTTTPLGLSAAAFCIAGFAAGLLANLVIRTTWFIAPLVAMTFSAVGIGLFAGIGALIGQQSLVRAHLFTIIGVVGVANGIMSLACWRPIVWAARTESPLRRSVGIR